MFGEASFASRMQIGGLLERRFALFYPVAVGSLALAADLAWHLKNVLPSFNPQVPR